MNRIIKILVAVLVVCLLFASCTSDPEPKDLSSKVKTEILEHKGTALGVNTLPVWVESYVSLGTKGLEKLSDFTEEYCFVAEMAAANLNAAQAWLNGFEMPQLIAREISSRVESLFVGAAVGAPEDDYGTYFENVVKTTTDVSFTGAKKVSDWWSLIRVYDPDIKNSFKDEYRVYVLYTIPRSLLDRQLANEIDKLENETDMTEAQKSAFENVKSILAQNGL
ncbi:MAG: hypothetical protein K5930_12835 [Treponemataceae bacterium]|nr:hypothetical protein [Treponemataceae bacterium]